MSKEKVIYGLYDDDDVILDAVKAIREKGHHIDKVTIVGTSIVVPRAESANEIGNSKKRFSSDLLKIL